MKPREEKRKMTAAGLRLGLRETRHQMSNKRKVSVCVENHDSKQEKCYILFLSELFLCQFNNFYHIHDKSKEFKCADN